MAEEIAANKPFFTSWPDQDHPDFDEECVDIVGYASMIGGFGEIDAVLAFGDYIKSSEFVHYRMHAVHCLADALVLWITVGDGTDYCPNYELYLQTVIHIIATWNGEGQRIYNEDLTPVRAKELLYPDSGQVVLPTLFRSDEVTTVGLLSHPLLRRATFEFALHERKMRKD